MTHYAQTLDSIRAVNDDVIAVGHRIIKDIKDGHTIREMSMDLVGNWGMEDRLGRWVMAAKWDALIKQQNGRLYEDARTWLSPSHFTVLWQIANLTNDRDLDFEYARDAMETCLIRNSRKDVVEVQPVEWLRSKLGVTKDVSTATLYHRLWKSAARALADAQGELARLGNDATRYDRRRVRLLKMVVRDFSAVETK